MTEEEEIVAVIASVRRHLERAGMPADDAAVARALARLLLAETRGGYWRGKR